ncbi:hypothetical protein A6R68_02592 [Neotoma lepida]|uniref:Uncharacterized protein n=1 Tax=Neotoma lepida TaxID=56216 RepID=A0A1A6GU66_NEOLE|nr:hypothetical protein A6R68_02592 [Neotoma lepida]
MPPDQHLELRRIPAAKTAPSPWQHPVMPVCQTVSVPSAKGKETQRMEKSHVQGMSEHVEKAKTQSFKSDIQDTQHQNSRAVGPYFVSPELRSQQNAWLAELRHRDSPASHCI